MRARPEHRSSQFKFNSEEMGLSPRNLKLTYLSVKTGNNKVLK